MSHDHAHHAQSGGKGRAFAIGVLLNVGFVVVEAAYGILAHSMSLLADAAHNLSDVLGLLLAWGASALAQRSPSRRRTYGLRRSTILAALANTILLLVAVGGVAWEAVRRIRTPAEVQGWTILSVAAIGVVVNGLSAMLFMHDRHSDANVRGAFLHLVADAGVSLGVVLGGIAIIKTGWSTVDPLVSLLVSAVVLFGTWGLLRDAVNLALDAVPPHIDPDAIRGFLASLPGVVAVHDLHIWAMSTTESALTVHLVMPWPDCAPVFLETLPSELHERFQIDHATVQIEPDDPERRCKQAPEHAL